MLDTAFVVPLAPVAKGRPRFGHGRVYTPERTRRWERTLATIARHRVPRPVISCPVRVDLLCVLARPQRLRRVADPEGLIPCPCKPDADNLRKAALDALSMAGVWTDDALVVDGRTLKVYAEKDGRPRLVVRIRAVIGLDLEDWIGGPCPSNAIGRSL